MQKNHGVDIHITEHLRFQILSQDPKPSQVAEGQVVIRNAQGDLFKAEPHSFTISNLSPVTTDLGNAQRQQACVLLKSSSGDHLQHVLTIDRYEKWPEALILEWKFQNMGSTPIRVIEFKVPELHLGRKWIPRPGFNSRVWTFQGIAVKWGQDFAFPLPRRYSRQNYMGHRDYGEGGGIPLAYCWNSKGGVALGHIEIKPTLWSLPVISSPEKGVRLLLEDTAPRDIAPGESISGVRTMISVHQGDFYAPLSLYRVIREQLGFTSAAVNQEDYQPAWCSWGYEFDVRPEEFAGVIPILKELNIHWLTLDDRWFDAYGDWNPRSDTFPGGPSQVRQMVDEIHGHGAYAQIWWYPLAVEDGAGGYESHVYEVAEILRQHPDWLCLNRDGSVARNNRGLAILDPSLPGVQEYILEMTKRFIQDWGFDGHKLDNIYTVPPCYNPTHHHSYPEESMEAMGKVYQLIYETTRSLKPYSVTQICPCATPPWYIWLPYMDQAVTADPTSSSQIRQRIKFYKGLLGPRFPVFADHVELSDGGMDFASEIGVGGIPGTKFIWPDTPSLRKRLKEWFDLPLEKKTYWQKWLQLYQRCHLSDGEYLNLYDLGFDRPEIHVIRKDGKLFYAIYADGAGMPFFGQVQLRGLDAKPYLVYDYVNDHSLGVAQGPNPILPVNFSGYLLLQAVPL